MTLKWDEKSEKLVHGFIHESERKFDAILIPDGIITMCLLYFFQFMDEWDKDHASEYISIDGNFLYIDNKSGRYSTYGKHRVNKGTHVWKFKIIELSAKNRHFLYFGIATDTRHKNGWFGAHSNDSSTNYYHYAFGVSRWITNKGVVCDPVYTDLSMIPDFHWYKGDDIEMTLDLSKQTLCYVVNGEEIVTINNIYNDFENKPDVKYRMANNMCDMSNPKYEMIKVELVSYECIALK